MFVQILCAVKQVKEERSSKECFINDFHPILYHDIKRKKQMNIYIWCPSLLRSVSFHKADSSHSIVLLDGFDVQSLELHH